MTCVRRKSNGKWDVILYVGRDAITGKEKRRIKRFPDKKSAELYAEGMRQELASGGVIPDSKITTDEFLDQWIDSYAPGRLAATTEARYRDLIRLYLRPAFGHIKLSRLSPSAIQGFHAEILTEDHLSSTTLLFIHRVCIRL